MRRSVLVRAAAAATALAIVGVSCGGDSDDGGRAPGPVNTAAAVTVVEQAPVTPATRSPSDATSPADPGVPTPPTSVDTAAPSTDEAPGPTAPIGGLASDNTRSDTGAHGEIDHGDNDVDVPGAPEVDAAAFAVVDLTSGRWLAHDDADEARPVASLMKLLTALVVLDAGDLDHVVTVPPLNLGDGESRIWLYDGQRVSRDVLLRSALVVSANDAVIALARDLAGSEEAFVDRMNRAAASLGLTGTHAVNPVGLDAGGATSTARDLITLTTVLMNDPWFRDAVATPSVEMFGQVFENTNVLLRTYPGAIGVKTGSTSGAGSNVIAAAERDGRTLVVVVLGASSTTARFESAAALLDWGFEQR